MGRPCRPPECHHHRAAGTHSLAAPPGWAQTLMVELGDGKQMTDWHTDSHGDLAKRCAACLAEGTGVGQAERGLPC